MALRKLFGLTSSWVFGYYLLKTKTNKEKKKNGTKRNVLFMFFYSVNSLLILLSRLFCSSALCFTLCLTAPPPV